jgi:hypothetical protein
MKSIGVLARWRLSITSAALLAALLLIVAGIAAQEAPTDSLSGVKDGNAILATIGRIAHDDLDECSGIQWWQDAWWAHNDSGGGPILYRAKTPDFADAERLAVPGAEAVDWEDITTYGGDLLVCDIGDNSRRRDDLALYRVTHADGKLALAARYAIAYPDGNHDAEAAFTIGGKLHIVTKHRGEGFTGVYRWAQLDKEAKNVGELVAKLDLDARAMVTAGDCDGAHVVLLSYTRIFVYAADKLEGKPLFSTRIHANQCKGIVLKDGRLVFTNEQRGVYAIDDYLKRKITNALPPKVRVELPREKAKYEPDGTGAAWKSGAYTLPLKGIGEDEYVRWMIADAYLMIAGKLRYEAFTSSSEQGPRLGTALILTLGTDDDEFLTGNERMFWLGDNGATGLDAWRLDVNAPSLKPVAGVKVKGEIKGGWMSFEYALPLTDVFGEGELPETFRINLWGRSLQEDEPRLSGESMGTLFNPYTWAEAELKN